MAIIKNKAVLQSYILTTAKYDFSVYEKRFLYLLVEIAQDSLKGVDLKNDCRKVEHDLYGFKTVTVPVSAMLDDDSKNHFYIKKALISLQKKVIEYDTPDVWESFPIVAFPVFKKYKETVTVTIHPKIWDCILDLTKGWRKFELKTAMSFESVYSMRFYELMSNQKTPMHVTIDELKARFGLVGRYKQINDFEKKVIKIAKKELDEKSPYSFEYFFHKTGRKITSVTLHPIYQPKFRDPELEKKSLQLQSALSWDLPNEVVKHLIEKFDFTKKEIKQNIDLFKRANQEFEDFMYFTSIMSAKSNRGISNPKGYFINAIRIQLEKKDNQDF